MIGPFEDFSAGPLGPTPLKLGPRKDPDHDVDQFRALDCRIGVDWPGLSPKISDRSVGTAGHKGDSMTEIAVTGATGHIGAAVSALLHGSGVEHRVLVRNPDSPRLQRNASVTQVCRCEYGDHDACVAALNGVDLLFMVSAAESADRLVQHRAFIDAAAEAGVGHIVYTSFLGAAADATFTLARTHGATEAHIRGAGVDFTFLRDSFYLDFTEAMVGDDGVIRGPASDGRCGFVARADVAASAATILGDPAAHRGKTYELTGPRAIDLDEVAQTISLVRGRQVSYHPETLDEAYRSRADFGAPDWQVDAWVSTYTAIASGEMSKLTDDVQRLVGRAPMGLEQYLRSNE
jgi:NAD(P)H dehydrogenase (quinone)